MNAIILYGSCYGTAKQYAEALSERTGISCNEYANLDRNRSYDLIIYVGALYAGGVLGLAKTFRGYPEERCHRFLILTVGLADPNDPVNRSNIRSALRGQLPAHVFESALLFHVRGGIDYHRLRPTHKAMMSLLYHVSKKTPSDKQDAETKAMIETYNQTVNFVDFESLNEAVKAIRCQAE